MVDDVTATDETRAVLRRVNTLYERLANRRAEIDKLEAYFRGEHPLAYASPEWSKVHQDRYSGFSDNWCGVVGREPSERTAVRGFRIDTEAYEPLSEFERRLWDAWELNDMPAQSSQGFLASTVAKRSGVLVWGDDNDEPVATWEHPSQILFDYAPDGRTRRAILKSWTDDDREFATYYVAGAVWKWWRPRVASISSSGGRTPSGLHVVSSFTPDGGSGGWSPVDVADSGDDTWPIKNPMGVVPGVEFPNQPMLGAEPLSDIAGTIPMQDAINLLWAYLFVAADHASMPARVVMGQEPPRVPILDENGQQIGSRAVDQAELVRGRMLWLTGQNTTIGQWDAAKLDVFTEVINVAARHVAAQTSTSLYLIHGELGNVNGETLTGMQAPSCAKVRKSHKFWRSPVQEIFRLFALVWNEDQLAEQCRRGSVLWARPDTRSDAQISDAALKDSQTGWPFEAILERHYDLDQTDVARYVEMARKDAERRAALAPRIPPAPPAGVPVVDDAAPPAPATL